jgi:hypothetical protein
MPVRAGLGLAWRLAQRKFRLTDEQARRVSELALAARGDILKMTTLAASGHPGGSMSSIDFFLVLWGFGNCDAKDPFKATRDRVVVSHGHVSPGAYSALARLGYFDVSLPLLGFRRGGVFGGVGAAARHRLGRRPQRRALPPPRASPWPRIQGRAPRSSAAWANRTGQRDLGGAALRGEVCLTISSRSWTGIASSAGTNDSILKQDILADWAPTAGRRRSGRPRRARSLPTACARRMPTRPCS